MLEFLKHFFRLQFLLIIVAIAAGIYYPQILERLKEAALGGAASEDAAAAVALHFESGKVADEQTLFTAQQLAHYNGEEADGTTTPLYLALLGRVYDVTKGAKHYAAGCAYNFFVGRDASVAFVTGEFDNFVAGEADDVVALKPNDLLSLDNWQRFYEKDYSYKGKLIGRFYDTNGAPTTYHHKYLALLEQARESKAATERLRAIYPDCNIEWSVEKGTRVWCTTTSGDGKERDWAGHPRKLFQLRSSSSSGGRNSDSDSTAFRCACIRDEELDSSEIMIKPYENCARLADECYYHVD